MPVFSSKRFVTFSDIDTSSTNRVGLLVLTPSRFRGDIKALNQTGVFNIFQLENEFQNYVSAICITEMLKKIRDLALYFNPNDDYEVIRAQNKSRRRLGKLLLRTCKSLNIELVISAAVHYRRDLDIGVGLSKLGIPYVVFHRENLIANLHQQEHYKKNWLKFGRFQGDAIIVQNKLVREGMLETHFIEAEKVFSLGSLRMDFYINKIKGLGQDKPRRNRKTVVLFSFNHCAGLLGLVDMFSNRRDGYGYFRLFDEVHSAIAELAYKNPNIDFIVKTKWGEDWFENITSIWNENRIPFKSMSNLRLTYQDDAHDLIFKADVVTGFGSTTLLEAAVAGKEIVFPLFAEAQKPQYRDKVLFFDELDVFTVAYSRKDYISLILEGIKSSFVSDKMNRRVELFEKYVSQFNNPNAVEQYTNCLKGLCFSHSN